MDKKYKNSVTKTIAYLVIIAICALIQNTAGLTVEIGNARCFLLIPVCIILGMGEDELFAGILGLFGGLLWDLTSAVHLGFNAVFLCICCFASAMFVTYIIRNTFITNLAFSVLTVFIYCVLYWLFFIIIKNVPGAELSIVSFYIPCAFYTAIATPIIYACINPIRKFFVKEITY